jgi:hypothetical protein
LTVNPHAAIGWLIETFDEGLDLGFDPGAR